MSLSVKELLKIGEAQLNEFKVENAAYDGKMLYCHLMNITWAQLILEYQKTMPDSLCEEYFKLLDRRCGGEPLQYITGIQGFMGYDFTVNPSVLIPRPETETLVEAATVIIKDNKLQGEDFLSKAKKEYEVLDLCCGSGAIGLSTSAMCPTAKVTLSDVSEDALGVAKINASKLGVSPKVKFESGNLLIPFKGRFRNRKFDMILSNPPYIRTSVIQTLQKEIREHEPMLALDGGSDGLDFYRTIIKEAADCLKKDGVIMLEIGDDQKEDVMTIFAGIENYDDVRCLQDLAGRDRVVMARLAAKKKK